MATYDSNGVKIVYDDIGEGYPIILLHGFAADSRLNWKITGWYKLLQDAGYRVIAPDNRGHGRSDKPTDPEAYKPEVVASDVIGLMDHLGIEQADMFGYSMGGRNAGWIMTRHAERFSSVVIGGVGMNLLKVGDPEYWIERGFELTADNKKTENLAVPAMAPLYEKVLKTGGRLAALSACLLGSFPSMDAAEFAKVDIPVLVIAGSKDTISGSPIPLAEAVPHARAVIVPGKTHLSVINDGFFQGAVIGFLGHVWQDDPRHSWL